MSKFDEASIINKIIYNFQKGNIHSSIEKMKNFIKKNPDNEVAIYNYGYMCDQAKFIDQAVKQYKKVIDINPKNWKAKFNLYINYIKNNKYTEALPLVNDVLKLKTNYQPALRDKGLILYHLKKPNEGLALVLNSIKQNPKDYIALNILGLIYILLAKYDLAEKTFTKAIKINANYAPSYNNLGRVFDLNNKKDLAFKHYKKALNINPIFQEAINNIAIYYNNTGNYKKAINLYLKAQQKNSKTDETILYNIAISYMNLEKYKIAEDYFKKSYALNPNSGKLKLNYAILLLSRQRFKQAWNFYEGRLKLDEFKLKNDHINIVKTKLWNGKKIPINKKILVIKEQGVGDEILYSSMYNEVLKSFQNVKIETDKRLIPLFKNSFNSEAFIPISSFSNSKKKLKYFDIVMYAASLGKIFRNSISDFPKKQYLTADKKNILFYKKRLLKINSKKKIGISWKSINKETGADKSLDLNLLSPILQNESFTFINMQYGETAKEIEAFSKIYNTKIINIEEIDLFNDFNSMAALIQNLDLFISVSSTTAHLAAALGIPTWIVKPKNHVLLHYWNQPNNNTPWYSNVKLFPFKKKWEVTIKDIKIALKGKFNQ